MQTKSEQHWFRQAIPQNRNCYQRWFHRSSLRWLLPVSSESEWVVADTRFSKPQAHSRASSSSQQRPTRPPHARLQSAWEWGRRANSNWWSTSLTHRLCHARSCRGGWRGMSPVAILRLTHSTRTVKCTQPAAKSYLPKQASPDVPSTPGNAIAPCTCYVPASQLQTLQSWK